MLKCTSTLYATCDQNIHLPCDSIAIVMGIFTRADRQTDSHSDYNAHLRVVQFYKYSVLFLSESNQSKMGRFTMHERIYLFC